MIDRLRQRARDIAKPQKDIAEELHVSPATVSFWFRGTVSIGSQYIRPLARALHMDPAEILDIVEWVLAHPPLPSDTARLPPPSAVGNGREP